MKCSRCGRNPAEKELDFYSQRFCRKCFLEFIEKRIRKHVRVNRILAANEKVLIVDDGSAASLVSKHFLENYASRLPFSIVKKGRADKIILPVTADDYIDDFLRQMFKGKIEEFYKKDVFSLVKVVSEKECALFARYKQLGKPKQKRHLLDKIEKKYIGTKGAMMKSIAEIRQIL